jgi:hypothetical protein
MFDRFLGALFVSGMIAVVLAVITAAVFYLLGWHFPPQIPPHVALLFGLAVASYLWMLLILTVPWDIHFRAKVVQFEIERSIDVGIEVSEKRRKYVAWIRNVTLYIAIGLHVLTAVGIAVATAIYGWRPGYFFAAFFIISMGFRPLGSAYDYVKAKLAEINDEVKFPREDTFKLRSDITSLEGSVQSLRDTIDELNRRLDRMDETDQQAHQDVLDLKIALERTEASFQSRIGQLTDEVERSLTKVFDQQDVVNGLRAFARLIKQA